jgi:hypothetical protein
MGSEKIFQIDPRVKAVGVSKLRVMNARFLRNINDNAYLIQDGETPLAVIVSYEMYQQIQKEIGL